MNSFSTFPSWWDAIPSYSLPEIARLRRTNCRRQINGGSLLKVPVPRFPPSFCGRRPHFQSALLLRGARKEVEVICAEIRLFHVPFPCSFHSFRLIAASTRTTLLYLALFPFPLHPSLDPSITAFVNTIIAGSASEAAARARPRPHSFVAHVHNASRTAEL